MQFCQCTKHEADLLSLALDLLLLLRGLNWVVTVVDVGSFAGMVTGEQSRLQTWTAGRY